MSETVTDITLTAPSLTADVLPAIGDNVERDDLRNALWRLSGWRLEARVVEAWLDLAERFAEARVAAALAEYRGVPLREAAQSLAEAAPAVTAVRERLSVRVEAQRETQREAAPVVTSEAKPSFLTGWAAPEGTPGDQGLLSRHLTCTKCEALKAEDEFGVDRTRPSGRKPQCKACVNAYQRERKARMKAERDEWADRQLTRLAAEGHPGLEGTPSATG